MRGVVLALYLSLTLYAQQAELGRQMADEALSNTALNSRISALSHGTFGSGTLCGISCAVIPG
jgi:hypothetical protein